MEISYLKRNLMNAVFNIEPKPSRNSIRISNGSNTPSPRTSLTPSNSEKSLKLRFEHLPSENSQNSINSNTPRTTHRQEESHKPISLVIIEKYFSDICQSIANKGTIDETLLSKATTMQDVLKDCLAAVPNLSLQFYVLMASALKEIQQIHLSQDENLYSALAKKLVQLASLIEENNYTSETDRANTQPPEEIAEVSGFHELGKELNIRIARVTARILNIWKKILCPQREAAVISCGFLLLYCEIDPSLKISPNARIPIDKAIVAMKNYLGNPGYVVTILRKTKEYVDKEMISVETIRRIHELLSKVTMEQVKTVDKTMTGLAIYELIVFAVKYYHAYAKENYKIDIFEKNPQESFDTEISTSREKMLELQPKNEEISKISQEEIIVEKKEYEKAKLQDQDFKDPFNIKIKSNNGETIRKKSFDITDRDKDKKLAATSKRVLNSSGKPSKINGKTKAISEDIQSKIKPKQSSKEVKSSPFSTVKAMPSPTRNKLLNSPSIKPLQPQKSPEQNSLSPSKISLSPNKPSPSVTNKPAVKNIFQSPIINSPKPLDKNLIAAKKIISSTEKLSNSSKTTPVRIRKNMMNPRSSDPSPVSNRDVLEEMQYQQYIEEKFRHFLIDKLKKETEKMLKSGLDRNDIKIVNEIKALKSKTQWIEEFEKFAGVIRFNAAKKLSDDKRYTAELIRAQKQLDILERYSNEF